MNVALRSRRGPIGTTWWAVALRGALEGILGVGRAAGGKADARAGRVQWIDVDHGVVRGAVGAADGIVAGRGEVAEARIDLPPFSADDREVVLAVARAHPDLAARLAAGEYPEQVERELARSEVSLLPRGPSELSHDCTCPDWPGPCRHVAALGYVLVEAVEQRPLDLFRVRGLDLEDLAPAGVGDRGTLRPEHGISGGEGWGGEGSGGGASDGAGGAGGAGGADSVADADTKRPDPGRADPDPADPGPGSPRRDPDLVDPDLLDPGPLAELLGPDVAGILLAFYRSGERGPTADPPPDADATTDTAPDRDPDPDPDPDHRSAP